MDVEELHLLRADYKLYVNFQLLGGSEPLTSALLKSQLCIDRERYIHIYAHVFEKIYMWQRLTFQINGKSMNQSKWCL